MEIIIKSNWSEELRIENIKKYISSIGNKIYEKCKTSANVSNSDFELISLDLCKAYAKSKIMPYIFNITCGSFEIIITEQSVKDVVSLSKINSNNIISQ